MRAALAAPLMFALIACATTSAAVTTSDYSLSIVANDAEQRFDIELESQTSKPLCLSVDDWPNGLGEMHYSSGHVFARVGEQRYAIRDQNFGYCIGSRCSHRIEPGQRLRGLVSYAEFPGASLSGGSSDLIFPLVPHFCARGEGQ